MFPQIELSSHISMRKTDNGTWIIHSYSKPESTDFLDSVFKPTQVTCSFTSRTRWFRNLSRITQDDLLIQTENTNMQNPRPARFPQASFFNCEEDQDLRWSCAWRKHTSYPLKSKSSTNKSGPFLEPTESTNNQSHLLINYDQNPGQ